MPWDGLHSRLSGLTEVKMTKRGNRSRSPDSSGRRVPVTRTGEETDDLPTERWDDESLAAWASPC